MSEIDAGVAPISPGAAPHHHRWRISTPEGRFSTGLCSCGAERQFRNSCEETTFFERYSYQNRLELEQ